MPIKKRSEDWEYWDVPTELKAKIKALAREQRKAPTRSEQIMWQNVRDRRLDDYKIRRQFELGPFILDFYCAEKRLAIEIDGPIHDQQLERDAERQQLIEGLGIQFVRVSASDVESHVRDVLEVIRTALNTRPDFS